MSRQIFIIRAYWTPAKMLLSADVDEYSFTNAGNTSDDACKMTILSKTNLIKWQYEFEMYQIYCKSTLISVDTYRCINQHINHVMIVYIYSQTDIQYPSHNCNVYNVNSYGQIIKLSCNHLPNMNQPDKFNLVTAVHYNMILHIPR